MDLRSCDHETKCGCLSARDLVVLEKPRVSGARRLELVKEIPGKNIGHGGMGGFNAAGEDGNLESGKGIEDDRNASDPPRLHVLDRTREEAVLVCVLDDVVSALRCK